jgi:hypothetical protein
MAKKQKRSVSKGSQLSETQRQNAAAPAASVKTASNRPALSGEFNPDYSHVVADLKKIGILAASFITILVVLSFFLN